MSDRTRSELGRLLRTACTLHGDFVLRSGRRSDEYFDKYLFESDPELLGAVVDFAVPLVPPGTEVLAGLELGGVAVATALSLRTGLPQVFVRKQAKTYGTLRLVEGIEVDRRQVLVVEDVLTTGGQVVASTRELRSAGAIVGAVLCVLDRRPTIGEGEGLLGSAELSVLSIFSATELDATNEV